MQGSQPSAQSSTRLALYGAAACAALFGVILVFAYTSPWARYVDASAFQGFLGLQRPSVKGISSTLSHLGNPAQVGLIGLALMAIAVGRGRPRVAAAILGLLFVTSVSSQVLKALLAYPRFHWRVSGAHLAPAAFPSGHSTAAMSLAICAVLAAPRRLRPLAAFVGVGFALAVSFSIVSLGWHLPSDVAGGYLLATFWGLVVVAGLRGADQRWPERTVRSRAALGLRATVDRVAEVGLTVAALAGVCFVALAGTAVVLTRPSALVGFARDHTSLLVVAPALGALALALLGGMTIALRRRG